MIGLAFGTVIGIASALVLGKWKGKAVELQSALLIIPAATYAMAEVWAVELEEKGYTISVEGFSPSFLFGLELFAAFLIATAYVGLRSRKGLTIDEFIQSSLVLLPTQTFALALAVQFSPLLLIPGLLVILLELVLSLKNPLKNLKARPCEGLNWEGECLTDEESRMVGRVGEVILLGGFTRKNFPRLGELLECLKNSKQAGKGRRALATLIRLLPLAAALAPMGVLTITLGGILVILSSILSAMALTIRRPECGEVEREFREFLRKNKRDKLEIHV